MTTSAGNRKPKPQHIPAYRRIESDLREKIQTGAWQSGTMIPGRRQLAAAYGVDLNTVQNALRILLDEGVLRADGRRGTFVTGLAETDDVDGGVNPVRNRGRVAGGSRRDTLTVGVIGALWAYNETTREPHDNWPAAILHSFECAMATMPTATVKFRHAGAEYSEDRAKAYFERLRELMAEGLSALVVLTPPDEFLPDLEEISLDHGIPVVIVQETLATSWVLPSVSFDYEFGGFQAARHLMERGYEHISVFCPYLASPYAESRRRGAEGALNRAGRTLDVVEAEGTMPRAVPDHRNQRAIAREAAREYLAECLPSWGIIAANDHAGHAIIDVMRELGLRPGRDIGVIGFDDLSESRIMDMSSLHPPLDAMGIEAASLLQQRLLGGSTISEVRLRSHLVSRLSTQFQGGEDDIRLDIGPGLAGRREAALSV